MSFSPSIARENASYRRGLILGLTMAEALLLLVFCLMIGLITYLQQAQKQRDIARGEVTTLQSQLAEARKGYERLVQQAGGTTDDSIINPALIETLIKIAGSSQRAVLDETWRRIVRNDEVVRSLAASGVKAEELTKDQIACLRMPAIDRSNANVIEGKAEVLDRLIAQLAAATGAPMLADDVARLAIAGAKTAGHQWPPIINLSEAGGYSFAVGSAALTPQFREKIEGPVVARLLEIASRYDVDIIEVVGHTDEQPINPRPSNLDRTLSKVILGSETIDALVPGDNAGLGLARAVSVVSALRANNKLSKLSILPFSGAQLINVDETLSRLQGGVDAKERRRIEIRLRKSSSAQ